MTRSAAIDIVREITHSSWDDRTMADLVDVLIALQVLNVDEPKPDLITDPVGYWLGKRAEADAALQDLCVPH